jgi:very-short-patch-repair endonuclease
MATKARAKRRPETALELALHLHMRALRLPEPEWGYRWHPVRRWRADAAWPERRLLLEVEGGVTPFRDKRTGELRQGRHTSILGYEGDCLKYSEAAICGWRLIRVTRRMVDDGRAVALVERALRATTEGAA